MIFAYKKETIAISFIDEIFVHKKRSNFIGFISVMECWSVKAHLLGDDGKTSEIRRISVPVTANYNQLYDKTKGVFPDLHNAEISLSWKGIKHYLALYK